MPNLTINGLRMAYQNAVLKHDETIQVALGITGIVVYVRIDGFCVSAVVEWAFLENIDSSQIEQAISDTIHRCVEKLRGNL